jgi:two-component system cell cycle sensor histidine kinase/response regulator CckA
MLDLPSRKTDITLDSDTKTTDTDNHSHRFQKILIVDDEASILRLLDRYLRQLRYQVVTATTVEQALNILQSNSGIGMVLTDINMMPITGIELFYQIRKHYPEIKVLIMTGNLENLPLTNLKQDGAAGLLTKPFSLKELETTLQSIQ